MPWTQRSAGRNWLRLALKLGLLLSDRKTWASVGERIRGRAEDIGEEAQEKYESATDRLREANQALRGGTPWLLHAVNFAGGVALGVGLGLLFAPASGEEIRSELRDKASDIKRKVSDAAVDLADLRGRASGE